MERLTFEGNFCDIAQCREFPCPYGNSCSQREVWERLKEYEDAEADGRVVVLPCKVGDELWTFSNYPRGKVYSAQVTDVSTLNGKTVINAKGFAPFPSHDVGRTMFLTREEAEKALEARKDG